MKFANIVSKTNIDIGEDFNVVKSVNDIIIGLPTLIIGWDVIKKQYPNYDITDRKLDNKTYWTFKKTEKREFYEEDLYKFKKMVFENLTSEINYVFVDPIINTKRTLKKIIKKLDCDNLISYHHNDMLYIYLDNIIFGVDLSLIEFIGLNKNKILSKIKTKLTALLFNINLQLV